MTIPQWTREEFDPSRIKIADDVLAERAARITPLIYRDDELYRFDPPENLRGLYLAADNLEQLDSMERSDWYVEVGRGYTHHGCGYYGIFKPSIAEVLAQLPDDPDITAFYLDTRSVRILDEGRGHICNVFWLTNKPRSEEWQRARMERSMAKSPELAVEN